MSRTPPAVRTEGGRRESPAAAPVGRAPGRRARTRRPTPLVLLVLANAVALSGNVVTIVAVPWLVLTTTGSAGLTGAVVAAGAVGSALGAVQAGRVVDVLGPVRASVVADLLSGLAVVPLPLLLQLDLLQTWHVVLLAAAGTLADSAGSTARQVMVPVLADSGGRTRERANALFTSAEHVGYVLGAPVAGLLVASVGVAGALWVPVAGFAFTAYVVGRHLRLPPHHRPRSSGRAAGGLRETAAVIRSDPALRALVVLPTLAVLVVGPLTPVVLPVLARTAYDDPVALGTMVAAYGAGGLLGAAGYGLLGTRVTRRRLYRGIFVAWPLSYAAVAVVPPLPLALVVLLTLGVAAGSLVPLQATVRQERAPAHLLARVVGLSTATIPVAAPVGALATGLLIDALGTGRALLLTTGAALLVGAVAVTSRGTRDLDPQHPPRPHRNRWAVSSTRATCASQS